MADARGDSLDVKKALNEIRYSFYSQFDDCFSVPVDSVQSAFREMLEKTMAERRKVGRPLTADEIRSMRLRIFIEMSNSPENTAANIATVYESYARINEIVESIVSSSASAIDSNETLDSRVKTVIAQNKSYLEVIRNLLKTVQNARKMSKGEIISTLKDSASRSKSSIGNELAVIITEGKKKKTRKESVVDAIVSLTAKNAREIALINSLEKVLADSAKITKGALLLRLEDMTDEWKSKGTVANIYIRRIQTVIRRSSLSEKEEIIKDLRDIADELEDTEKTVAGLSRIRASEKISKEEVIDELQNLLSSVYNDRIGRKIMSIVDSAERENWSGELIIENLKSVVSRENLVLVILSQLHAFLATESKGAGRVNLRKFIHELVGLFSIARKADHEARRIMRSPSTLLMLSQGGDDDIRKQKLSVLIVGAIDEVKEQMKEDADELRIGDMKLMFSDYASGDVDAASFASMLKDSWYASSNRIKNEILKDLKGVVAARRNDKEIDEAALHLCGLSLKRHADQPHNVETAVAGLKVLRVLAEKGNADVDIIAHAAVDALGDFDGNGKNRRMKLMCVDVLRSVALKSPTAMGILKRLKDSDDSVIRNRALEIIEEYDL